MILSKYFTVALTLVFFLLCQWHTRQHINASLNLAMLTASLVAPQ